MVSYSLSLLVCAREGLTDLEISDLLSCHSSMLVSLERLALCLCMCIFVLLYAFAYFDCAIFDVYRIDVEISLPLINVGFDSMRILMST